MNPISFEKTIERDSTFVTQGVWSRIMAGENYLKFAAGNPFAPVIIHYATPDNLQIWENKQALEWFAERLLEENRKGTAFLEQIAKDQKEILEAIHPFWDKQHLSNLEEAQEYLKIMERGLTNITLVYYTGGDVLSPKEALAIAEEVRKTDEFFARNDVFIVESVKAAGYDESLGAIVMPGELENLPDRTVLEKRRNGCVLVGGTELFPGSFNDFVEHHSEYQFDRVLEAAETIREVKGQVAQKGQATGRVRIVRSRKQAAEVQEGEIIVSPMTTPDFIAAMHRAAAFVTDEGGIVCHAAIVARELKKPCVIGTKIGTQIFKDGDIVEVDANTGIARLV